MNRCDLPGSGEEVSSGFSYITILNQNSLPFLPPIKTQVAFIHDVRFLFPALLYLQLRYD